MMDEHGEEHGGLDLGLLWYDADPRRPAETKIAEAAERHEEKFGAAPNVCHVNPDTYQKVGQQVAGTRVMANRWIRPNHFWLGIDPTLPLPKTAGRLPKVRNQPAVQTDHRKSAGVRRQRTPAKGRSSVRSAG